MIHTKTLPAHQVCPGAPTRHTAQDLELPRSAARHPYPQYRQILDKPLWETSMTWQGIMPRSR